MIDLRNADSKASKIVYALVIIAVAILVPAYFIFGSTWEGFEITPMAIIFPILYLTFVAGFVFWVFNIRGVFITTPETDERLHKKYQSIKKPLTRILWFLIICNAVYAGYQLWKLLSKA